MRILQMQLLLSLCTVLFFITTSNLSAQHDIQCTVTKDRYDQPYQCAKVCKAQLDAQRCFLQPQLKALDDGFFKTYYNASLFFAGNNLKAVTCYDDSASKQPGAAHGNGVKFDATLGKTTDRTLTLPTMILPGISPAVLANPGAQAYHKTSRDLLVERSFGRWLHPWSFADFNVTWSDEKGGEWADLEADPDACGRYNLTISVQSLCRTPAAFVVMLGHEMVHREQYGRTYKSLSHRDDLGRLRADLHEVEAYAWELRQGNFNWKFDSIDRDPLYPGLTKDEVKESTISQKCYEWRAERTINEWRTLSSVKRQMDGYFKEDPWVSSQWLPQHKDWETHKLDPIPEADTCCPLLESKVAECKAYMPYPKTDDTPKPPSATTLASGTKPCTKN